MKDTIDSALEKLKGLGTNTKIKVDVDLDSIDVNVTLDQIIKAGGKLLVAAVIASVLAFAALMIFHMSFDGNQKWCRVNESTEMMKTTHTSCVIRSEFGDTVFANECLLECE